MGDLYGGGLCRGPGDREFYVRGQVRSAGMTVTLFAKLGTLDAHRKGDHAPLRDDVPADIHMKNVVFTR